MTVIAKIDDEPVTADDFVKLLKLGGNFDSLIEGIMIDKLTVLAAKKAGITVTIEEVQERFDQIRRIEGLHRAKDTHKFLDDMGVTLDEFERYLTDTLYKEKMTAEVSRDEAIQDYFNLNSPRFDCIEISHIVVDSEGKAKELLSLLADDPDSLAELAREHSLATDTKDNGGVIGSVTRGSLPHEIEAKVFNASPGDLVGPFPSPDGLFFEIFKVNAKHLARLDEATAKQVRKLVNEKWLEVRAQEHRIEIL